jgi:hypothetical protein
MVGAVVSPVALYGYAHYVKDSVDGSSHGSILPCSVVGVVLYTIFSIIDILSVLMGILSVIYVCGGRCLYLCRLTIDFIFDTKSRKKRELGHMWTVRHRDIDVDYLTNHCMSPDWNLCTIAYHISYLRLWHPHMTLDL